MSEPQSSASSSMSDDHVEGMPIIKHPNGQITHYILDDFTDPWTNPETILIQHGFARHSAFWYKWIPVLAKHYRVIRRDARGHGFSSAPSRDKGDEYVYDIDTILDEIIDTLDALKVDKVHYLGESTGGIWGEFLAAKFPDRVASLTICASPLYMPASAQRMLAFGHASWPEACRKMGSRGWGEALVGILGADRLGEEYLRWWLEQVGIADGGALGDHAELLCEPAFDARRIMGRIKCSMLLLSPGNSQLVDLAEQRQLCSAVEGARMEVIEGFAHEIYIDQAEVCQEKYLSFLSGLAS